MNPPMVFAVTKPRSYRTIKTTAMVSSIFLLLSMTWRIATLALGCRLTLSSWKSSAFKHGRFPYIPHDSCRVSVCRIEQPFYQKIVMNNHVHTPLPLCHAPPYKFKLAAAQFRNIFFV